MSIHLIRNIHTVLGSILLDRIFLEASAGYCCCCCAGWVRTKRETTRDRLQAENNIDRLYIHKVDRSTLNARLDFFAIKFTDNVSL